MANDTLPASRPCAIPVVENNQDAAATMARVLACFGHKVTIASDGVEALRVAEETQPDVVLLDIGLPGMSGFQVARELTEISAPKRPLLVAITGYGQEDDRRRCLEAGFDHFLLKPYDPNELARLLAACVDAVSRPGTVQAAR